MTHFYLDRPDHTHWHRAGGIEDAAKLDPVVRAGFTISPDEPVATAGSCFAQHVMRYLAQTGFNAMVTERAPSMLDGDLARAFQYGLFTTRSGNVYTARQLRQLIERAYGLFEPTCRAWRHGEAFVDPFRPQVVPFTSAAELQGERERHFAAVRAMVEGLSVFVFTLGLTEAWCDPDGAVFPLAPGVAGGEYQPGRHRPTNFTVEETVEDLAAAIALLRERNPAARVILTVSPVPLMATFTDRHVLAATIYSKAVLRVAAETIAATDASTDYFPSYEIITAPHTRGAYFGPDARSVTEAGVSHVMGLFMHHYGRGAPQARVAPLPAPVRDARCGAARIVEVWCDEEALGRR